MRRTFSLNVLVFVITLLMLLGCGPKESITAGEIMGKVREQDGASA